MAPQRRFSLLQTPAAPRVAQNPSSMTPHLVQFKGDPNCLICMAGPNTVASLTADLLKSDTPDIPALAQRYDVKIKDLLQHIYDCMAADPFVNRSQINEAASLFAEEVVTALARTMSRAEQILNELFDEKITDEETGDTVYPNRTINLALAYNQVAKTHAQTLDGIVAAGQRRQIAARLSELEAAGVTQVQRGRMEQIMPTASPVTKPRRSVASLLALAPTPTDDPLS